MRWTRGGRENPESFPSKHVTMPQPKWGGGGKVSLVVLHTRQKEARTVPEQTRHPPRSTWKNVSSPVAEPSGVCSVLNPHPESRQRAELGGGGLPVPKLRKGVREGERARPLCLVGLSLVRELRTAIGLPAHPRPRPGPTPA